MHCGSDSDVRTAPTVISGQCLINVVIVGLTVCREKCGCAHDLACLAVPTLWHVVLNPCGLQWMEIVAGGEAFDCGDWT